MTKGRKSETAGNLRKILISGLFALASFTTTDSLAATASDYSSQQEYTRAWQLGAIGAATAWARGFNGAGKIVAVFDSGFNRTHVDLSSQLAGPGYDAVTGSEGVAADVNGHGTFVAGIIGAAQNGTGMEGVAYGAKLLPIRIVNPDGSVNLSDSNLAAGIRYATSHGANVMNNSWNTSTPITGFNATQLTGLAGQSIQAWREAVNANRIVVFAAGNDGAAQPGLYAALPKVFPELQAGWIAAVAIDGTGRIANYSNRCGDAAAWCMAAPGSSVVSTMRNSDTTYGTGSGTSFAAPVIAGAVAVLQQEWPSLTNAQIKEILFRTANKSGVYADAATYGQGLLDLAAATAPIGNPTTPTNPSDPSSGTPSNGKARFGRGWGIYGRSFGGYAHVRGVEDLQMITFDDYGRDFYMNVSNFFDSSMPSFDTVGALRDFGNGMQLNKVGETVYGFAQSDSKTTIGGAQFEGARMLVETPISGTVATAAFNINPSYLFGLAPSEVTYDANLVESDAVTNPYMSLAKNPVAFASKFNLTSDSWMKVGGFFGEQATDPNAPVTLTQDPNYSAGLGKVYGGVAEVGTKIGKKSGIAFTAGYVKEENAMLGSISSGITKLADSTSTSFVGISAKFDLGGGFNAFGGAEMGHSKVESANHSIVQNVSDISSESFRLGLTKTGVVGKADTFGFVVSQPMRVNSANASLSYANSQNADGSLNFVSTSADLSASAHELDMQAFYSTEVSKDSSFSAGLMLRANADHVEGRNDAVALARYKLNF